MLTTFFLCLLATGGAASPTPTAWPPAPGLDIIQPGWRGVDVTRKVDVQALRQRCCVQYRVRKGDTLAAIARRFLGAASRYAELGELNKGLDPSRLTIGQRIWLPPRDPKAPKTFVYLTQTRPFQPPRPYALGDRVFAKWGEFAFLVVGADHRAELKDLDSWDQVVAMERAKKLLVARGKSQGGYVRSSSKVVRMTETVRVCRDRGGRLRVETLVERFDADDKPIIKDAKLDDGGQMWLLLCSLGGVGLVWRRGRAVAARPREAASPA